MEPNVERITPPHLVRRRVEVKDVDSDDNSDDKIKMISHAPQVEDCAWRHAGPSPRTSKTNPQTIKGEGRDGQEGVPVAQRGIDGRVQP